MAGMYYKQNKNAEQISTSANNNYMSTGVSAQITKPETMVVRLKRKATTNI